MVQFIARVKISVVVYEAENRLRKIEEKIGLFFSSPFFITEIKT